MLQIVLQRWLRTTPFRPLLKKCLKIPFLVREDADADSSPVDALRRDHISL